MSCTPISLTLSALSPFFVLSTHPFQSSSSHLCGPCFTAPFLILSTLPPLFIFILPRHTSLPFFNRFFWSPHSAYMPFLSPFPSPLPLLAWCSLPSLHVSFPSRYLFTAPLSCICRREGCTLNDFRSS